MIHGGIEEKLDGRWKFFVPFPEDVLKGDTRKGLKNERSISNLNGFPSGSDARLFERPGGLPKSPLQGFCDPPGKNTRVEKASRNILICHPFPRDGIAIRTDQVMKEKNPGHKGNHLWGRGMEFCLGELNRIGL
jgi:hypothetical protein